MPCWSVDIIRSRAEHLGTVEAATEKEAIEKAAKLFNVDPGRQNRIVATRVAVPISSLSDDQLAIITNAAQPLNPSDRTRFMEAVASRLRGQELGDGAVGRLRRELQAHFFKPPVDGRGPRPVMPGRRSKLLEGDALE